jgi:hypothetical protein
MPTSFTLGPTEILADGRYQVSVNFVHQETKATYSDSRKPLGVIRWRDAAIVTTEGDHFAIDDIVYDADATSRDKVRLSESFQGCRGRRWMGGR